MVTAEGRLTSPPQLLPIMLSPIAAADAGTLAHLLTFAGAAHGGGLWSGWNNGSVAIAVTALAGVALALTLLYSSRSGNLKLTRLRWRRKRALSPQLWKSLFSIDGRIVDEIKFLKEVRSGGVDPSIRADVWPFLLGMYDLDSTETERNDKRMRKRKEYGKLRSLCQSMSKKAIGDKKICSNNISDHNADPQSSDDFDCALSSELTLEENEGDVHTKRPEEVDENVEQPDDQDENVKPSKEVEYSESYSQAKNEAEASECKPRAKYEDKVEEEDEDKSGLTFDIYGMETDSYSVDGSLCSPEIIQESNKFSRMGSFKNNDQNSCSIEDFGTWQRIIRLDALRANAEWVPFSPDQAAVSEVQARQAALDVVLEDYDHLEPCRIYHAARLVAILEAYAVYDPEIGYCQGMSDLLSPVVAVLEEDHKAFWCFVGFMGKARHNFRLDEIGIRRQLSTVSKIIKNKDSHLYKHLEMLQAEDCFFVYRMVVVLFRRELTFGQTLCLWEVMWADQAAIRAGIEKFARRRVRQPAPPTDDLLLYAIAACVLRRRKLIIEKYNSIDEILRECNSMAGQLDVWELLDDAHDLVLTLHDKL